MAGGGARDGLPSRGGGCLFLVFDLGEESEGMVGVWNVLESFWAPMSKMVHITFNHSSLESKLLFLGSMF